MQDNQVILDAVRSITDGAYGGTAIKLELEAQLDRNEDYCEYCEDGRERCGDCDGDYSWTCLDCDGGGTYTDSDDVEQPCERCAGEGLQYCNNDCEDGYFDCGECDGRGNNNGDAWSVERCHNYIMERLSQMGLAERTEEGRRLSKGLYTHWQPLAPLTYAEFYRDGSVDSEFTVTIRLDDQENIFLLPELIEIWNDLSEAVTSDNGSEIDLRGAGMHIAVLQDVDGRYPVDVTEVQLNEYNIFRQNALRLLPALYFLGSHNTSTRGLQFREPRISHNSKYSAIYYHGSAMEFRVFDTCYHKPDAILDNVVVISNMLRFWTKRVLRTKMTKLPNIRFGVDNGNDLERFFKLPEHLEYLNIGLEYLKPAYYTTKQVKEQRGFKRTRRHINSELRNIEKDCYRDYAEYEERFYWRLEIEKHYAAARALEGVVEPIADEVERQRVESEAVEKRIEYYAKTKKSVEKIFEERREQYLKKWRGSYAL